ncbi:MAG: hypothetical protein PHF66_01005 [Desulfobacteraceae bacterium]|jgi:hypothetical protein|nr:hypothetical protein [Desulfobacteraceae bacterium]MDD3991689.1 hypothetical protein [Desulfobacteraceae bacterium]
MKMLMVAYDAACDDEVLEILARCDAPGFTRWKRVSGRGRNSDPRMDDSVWPGYNNVLLAVVEDGQPLENIREALSRLHRRLGGKGLKVFSWPVAEEI